MILLKNKAVLQTSNLIISPKDTNIPRSYREYEEQIVTG
jgi:hypothetical protein